MIGLDVSRSLAAQGPAYGVRQVSDVSGLGAGTETLRGQEPRQVSWLSSSVAGEALRSSCCCVMSCVVQTCNQSRIEPDSVGHDGHDGPMWAIPAKRMKASRERRRPRRRRVWRSSANASSAPVPDTSRRRSSPAVAVVCALASPGCSSPLPRTARQRPSAHSARDFLPPPRSAEARAGISAPPCARQGRFSGGRSAWTTGCRETGRYPSAAANARTGLSGRRPPPSGCPRRAPAPPRRPRADGRSSPVGRAARTSARPAVATAPPNCQLLSAFGPKPSRASAATSRACIRP